MINFNNVKIIKKIGAGMFGIAYLVKYEDNKYALKIQKILEKQAKKNYNYEIWRELDLYKYIDKLNENDQLFFMKLYGYEIYDNCTRKQIRPIKIDSKIDPNDKFSQKIKKMDESLWCIKFLLEYKGNLTLEKFLFKNHELKTKQIYSIMLQIIKIHMILYKGGYSHGDMHAGNIMINKTNKNILC